MNVSAVRKLGACANAVAWLAEQESGVQAWRDCQRGDWMLWLLGRLVTSQPWSDDRKPLLACCLDCALTVKHLWPAKQKKRIAAAVGVLRKWIAGKATVEQAKKARRELSAAYAAAAAAAYAADAAAADAADAAVYAYAADAAAYAYAAAVYAGNAADARTKMLVECAAIVRKHYPKPPRIRGG